MALASGMRLTPARIRGRQSGTATVSINAATNGTTTVTFATPFDVTPVFLATIVGGAGALIRATVFATSVSATQATIRVDLNAAATVSVTVHWLAVE